MVLNERINETVHVNIYDIATGYVKKVIKISGEYVKAEECSQNEMGTRYCLPYFDSGYYKFIIFDNEG